MPAELAYPKDAAAIEKLVCSALPEGAEIQRSVSGSAFWTIPPYHSSSDIIVKFKEQLASFHFHGGNPIPESKISEDVKTALQRMV